MITSVEIKLNELQKQALQKHGHGIDAKLYQFVCDGKRLNAYWPVVAVGGGTERVGDYCNIKWENVWTVVFTKKRLNQIVIDYGVRPKPYIVFCAKIYNGVNMYMVAQHDTTQSCYFHTKKEAAKWIRENFTGDEKRIRLYDLKWAGRCRPTA